MKGINKRILSLLFLVFVLVTTSYAWLLNRNATVVSNINVDYSEQGSLYIVNTNITAWIEIQNADGNYEKLTKGFVFDDKQMIPGAVMPFKIVMKNNSDTDVRLKLSLYLNVEEENKKILDKFYVDVMGGTGYNGISVDHVYKNLSDIKEIAVGNTKKYIFGIYTANNKLVIPKSRQVELNCSFYFDSSADASYQNMTFAVDYFRLER